MATMAFGRWVGLLALVSCAERGAPPAAAVAPAPLAQPSAASAANAGPATQKTSDQQFETLAKAYTEELLQRRPELATTLGDHRYDDRLDDYSALGVQAERRSTESYLAQLNQVPLEQLNRTNSVDYRILRHNLEARLFEIDTLRAYEWNPLHYNVGNAIYGLLARDFAALPARLQSVKGRLKALPGVLAAARAQLKNPPRIHVETALTQNRGNIALVRDELASYLNQAPELKSEFAPLQAEAVRALEAYGQWLEKDVLPQAKGEFRIGDAKFRKKLYFALESDLTKEQILEAGQRDLEQTLAVMYETALPLFKKYFPKITAPQRLNDKTAVVRAVLGRLGDQHPTNDTIVALTKAALARQTEFVRAHDLVQVPSEPVNTIVMPEFQRGVAVATCDSPGPLEKSGATFFNIAPAPADWSAQQVDSFYREYNNYMVENLSVHEAMPGHYLQGAHANRFQAPTLLRAIFSSGTFAEGWATYAEQVMVEAGYGGPEVKMQQLKMHLRAVINAIIDQKIHTAGMTEQEALDLMMNSGFQEKGEAAGKWRRACLTSSQLSTYFVGNLELNGIRKAHEAKHPGAVSLRQLHDSMLSFGTPAPKYVKELMGL